MSSRRQKLLARVNWYRQSSLKYITDYITGNKFYYRGGRYRQVSLYKLWVWESHSFCVDTGECGSIGFPQNYSDIIMSTIASQITSVSGGCSIVCSGADQSSASLFFVRRIHRRPERFPLDYVIMNLEPTHTFLFSTIHMYRNVFGIVDKGQQWR